MLCYAMLSRPSSTLPVFEEKVLVVAGEGWGSNVEQCCSRCAKFDDDKYVGNHLGNFDVISVGSRVFLSSCLLLIVVAFLRL